MAKKFPGPWLGPILLYHTFGGLSMRYAHKMHRYTAFTRGLDRELVRIPLRARNDADAVGRAVYQCEGLRQAVAPVRDVSRSLCYILIEVTADEDNGRAVWENPLLERGAQDPAPLYLMDRDRGWV